MFKRLKARKPSVKRSPGLVHDEPPENLYCRPHFLHQTPRETSLDQTVRPVIFPPRNKKLPWSTGYAEVVNAGKSIFNEDQATCKQLILKNRVNIDEDWVFLCPSEEPQNQEIMATYWGLFDGHGGPVAAIQASKHLHHCIKEQLEEIFNVISKPSTISPPIHLMEHTGNENEMSYAREKEICIENVVRGAVEVAFKKCDELIGQYQISGNETGGCTVLVVLHLQGKLYVASAGDSRAIAVQKNDVIPLSNEFTAVTERQRIQHLTRVMGTTVVTRGLGDHKLMVYDTDLCIKPFLSCIPEVTVFDLGQHEFGQTDALIMATDGLWDVMSNKDVADITEKFLDEQKQDPCRYAMLAQYLVLKARGVPHSNDWILEDGSFASLDDISVFVIPLYHLGGTA
ncbi:protein phosphatase 1M-like isoform X3 [Mobula birostris]|uniref:protein phosphatase 1M-like isoform X3 n=1 Tax=Mobula birostris TaxID=1983395 RepID=UPI003B283EA6